MIDLEISGKFEAINRSGPLFRPVATFSLNVYHDAADYRLKEGNTLKFNWLKKNKAASAPSETEVREKKVPGKEGSGSSARQKAQGKPPVKKSRKKTSRETPWQVGDFRVPEVEGKTRFHDLALHDKLMRAIHKSGFTYCTPIQADTLPVSLEGSDLIGKAQTGTGKTAAFLITIIDQILCHPLTEKRYLAEPRALIIAPTRELVKQIEDDAKSLCKYTDLSVVSLVGGEKYERQEEQLNKQFVDLLVATPGRLIDFLMQKKIFIDRVEVLVLDEADRMLDMGFIPQVKQIVRATPHKENRQTLLFSATFDQDILNLSASWTVNPERIDIAPDEVATKNVEQINWMVSDVDKVKVIANLVRQENIRHCIVFANRKDQSQRLHKALIRRGCDVGLLTGDIQQSKRTQTLKAFKEGRLKVLIATDVVGRGIHIEGITHVINYNLPQEPENYVHRIGRTGRAGAKGTAINLIGEEDTYDLPQLEKLLGEKLPLTLPPGNLLEG